MELVDELSNDSTVAIYIASHKQFEPPQLNGYVPIEVGAALRSEHLGFQRDDDGVDIISAKNETYCELTALWWAWKYSPANVVGLCHYRRYFSRVRTIFAPDRLMSQEEAVQLLDDNDMILPEKFYWRHHTVATGYDAGNGCCKDLATVRSIIGDRHPSYLDAYDDILEKREASYCNMFVCRKDLFNEYCEWLFDVLGEAERRIDIKGYSPQERRVYGYLSEILLNVWVLRRRLSVYYYPIYSATRLKRRQLLSHIEGVPLLNAMTRSLYCIDAII